ncbi:MULTISPECIES: hypothetical protein [Actibacterium]|uniref:Uncharacterized protein n=1 Tax=Actibacterium naphthalenivorans TaxID=1614693 RepID=A0A840CEF3_9RHOB|nr:MULTISPECIES: hypothetical protein [Actibacterium]ALG91126.1 hypothetical protein TQ29_14190 [Actibacterium sp. EMB200-NS6]MBB4022472.1 hypothetical protein [Actibacterium naphthalenivorans]
MILKDQHLDLRKRGTDRERLVQDVDSVVVLLNHPRDAAHLAPKAGKPLKCVLLAIFHRSKPRFVPDEPPLT